MSDERCHFCGDERPRVCLCMYPCRYCGVIGHEHSRDGEGSHNFHADGTPELDRQSAIIASGQAETAQAFYDWLQEKGYRLCRLDEDDQYWPAWEVPEQLLADFFGIDRNKIEVERRALLEELRTR